MNPLVYKILRTRPYLTLYNYGDITDRVQAITKGDMFFGFNRLKNRIELHSVYSFRLSAISESRQTSIPKPILNDWILRDIQVRSNQRFLREKRDEDIYMDVLYEEFERNLENTFIAQGVENIKDLLGR